MRVYGQISGETISGFLTVYIVKTLLGGNKIMIPPSDFPDISKLDSVQSNAATGNEKVSPKVAALRAAIANGTYQINTKTIAQAMVQSGVLDE
jgi:hypothetical protein